MADVIYRFGDFDLCPGKGELLRDGRRLRLERKPFELLVLLVSQHGQVVTREEIARRLWEQEVFVDTEHGINTATRKLRQTLGDSSDLPKFVQTISGSGYRFIATVSLVEREPAKPHGSAQALSVEAGSSPALETLPESPPPPEAAPAFKPVPQSGPSRRWLVPALCGSALVAVATLSLVAHLLPSHALSPAGRAAIHSIAVLPLQNLSGDPAQAYFADGMTDELTTELARIPNLRVASRTSVVMVNQGAGRSLPDIARQLDVDAIVEGSTLRSGDRIRITAQLLDARTDRHLWAQSFEGSAADVLSLQDSVAEQIASQASFVLLAPPPHASVNPAAHDAYLRGRYFFNKQDFARSAAYLKQAVDLDPNDASAQAGYASALEAASTFNLGTPDQLMPRAVAAARQAIRLDPRNGEAYTALGSVETIYERNWIAAEQDLKRGISLNPSDSIAEFKYSVYLDAMGRPGDAVTHMRRALQLDPFSFLMNLRLGVALYYDGQLDAALAQLKRAAEMEAQSSATAAYLGLVYEGKGEHDLAVENDAAALHAYLPKLESNELLRVYRREGWKPYWRARSRALLDDKADSCRLYKVGADDVRVNELDHAFVSFGHALESHCFYVTFLRVDPVLRPIRNDPRYLALLARMHE